MQYETKTHKIYTDKEKMIVVCWHYIYS